MSAKLNLQSLTNAELRGLKTAIEAELRERRSKAPKSTRKKKKATNIGESWFANWDAAIKKIKL